MNYNRKRHKIYNSSRYVELLEYSQNLEKEGKKLYLENKNDYLELCKYQAALEEHAFWQHP